MNIAINTYSLRNEFSAPDIHEATIKLCKDLSIDEVEILDRDVDVENIQDLKKRYKDQNIHIFSLAPHVKLLTKQNTVEEMIEGGKKWLDLAHQIGAECIRVQLSDGPFPRAFPPFEDFSEEEWEDYRAQMEDAADFTQKVADPLVDLAEDLNVKIGIETHHSYSSNYIYQEEVNKRYPSSHLGWVFDIGNYENDDLRWKALEVIKDKTFYVHAKSYKFDEQGFETKLDYPKACKILNRAGFDGNWSIEFEGKYNGILGVLQTNEVVKYSIAQLKGEDYQIKTGWKKPKELLEQYGK